MKAQSAASWSGGACRPQIRADNFFICAIDLLIALLDSLG